MRNLLTVLFVIFIPVALFGQVTGQIDKKNWTTHPKIEEIRKVYKETEELISSGKLKVSKRSFKYCEPYIDTDRAIYADAKGLVLKYANSKGSDDSAVTQSFYYDMNGKLRFILAECGAVNGTELEVRVYFDEKGKRLWEDRKLIKGEWYTFPDPWPEEEFLLNPEKEFKSQNKCSENKK